VAELRAARAHRPAFIVFLGLWIIYLAVLATPAESLRMQHVVEALFLVSAAAMTLIHVARRLPFEHVLIIALLVGAAACVLFFGQDDSHIGTLGIPVLSEWKEFGLVPFALPLIWVANIVGARGTVEFLLRRWREHRYYGFWLIGMASLLAAVAGVAWRRRIGLEVSGSLLATAVTLMLCVPWFIDKRGLRHTGDWYPCVTWGLTNAALAVSARIS
jgi:hypothetical protein